MKRFYQEVTAASVEGGFQVMLDHRGVKTVGGVAQIVSSERLADALAAEWDAQGEKIDPASLPMRDMIDYAIDVVTADQEAVVQKVLAYGDTDTLLYRADPDEPLYSRQQEVWEPIVAAFEARYGVEMVRVSGIIHRPQSEEALATLRTVLAAQSPLTLAGLELLASLAASLVTALSVIEAEADAKALWRAASLEEDWQIEQWGKDEEAEARRAKREADFLKACEMVRLAGE